MEMFNLLHPKAFQIPLSAEWFYEATKYLTPDDPKYEYSYKLHKFKKNALIIFNHDNFESDQKRTGTEFDVAIIKKTFKKYLFDVGDETTYNDLRREQLFYELKKFSSQDFKDYGCICIVILTHGQDHGYLKAFDTRYLERDVIECFDARANPSLVGKPVIFIIQACRGRYPSYKVDEYTRNNKPPQNIELDGEYFMQRKGRPMESDANMIIFHSTFFGRASIRVPDKGTWFIQILCDQIMKHGARDHLEDIFRNVRQLVAEMEHEGAKQMPVVTSTLLKRLYLPVNQNFLEWAFGTV